MAITDLTNTTWYVPSGWIARSGLGTFNVNLRYNNLTYDYFLSCANISLGFASDDGDLYASSDNVVFGDQSANFYGNTDSYIFEFSDGDDIKNPILISWLETNGIQLEVTDLTNTTWTIPSGWKCEAGYGQFSIKSTINSDVERSSLYLGYSFNYDDLVVEPNANTIYTPAIYTSSESLNISITGGTDATNLKLIAWLTRYGAIEEPAIPSIIKGALVPNATAYSLYEKITTGETVEYVFKAVNTEINFDLRPLDLSAGAHTFVVQATAQGYESSDYSNEVTYTIEETPLTNLSNTVWQINLDNLPGQDTDDFFAYNVKVRMANTTNAYSSYLKWVNAGDTDGRGLWLSNNNSNSGSGSQMFAVAFGTIIFEYIEFGSEGTDLTNSDLINWLETHFILTSTASSSSSTSS